MNTSVIHRDPDVLSGTLVFKGTQVPFQTLLDYLEVGDSLDTFLLDFPTVTKEQAVLAFEEAKEALPVPDQLTTSPSQYNLIDRTMRDF